MSVAVDGGLRELAEQRFEHPLVSAFLDLDPGRFATPVARETAINSLLDQGTRELRTAASLNHSERVALSEDIARIGGYLHDELAASGACSTAVYSSQLDDVFLTFELAQESESRLVIDSVPQLEPLLPALEPAMVCVALVNRRQARLFTRERGATVRELAVVEDDVHGQHRQGGWSEPNYERSVEAEVDDHLRHVATRLFELWRTTRFDRLVLGGPHEVVRRVAPMLHPDLRRVQVGRRMAVDLSSGTIADVEHALTAFRCEWQGAEQSEALRRLLASLDNRGSVVTGLAECLGALAERRVEALVLVPGVDRRGSQCPVCGQLYAGLEASCPGDGSALVPLQSLRSAMICAAIRQDARVIPLDDRIESPQAAAIGGIGALLHY